MKIAYLESILTVKNEMVTEKITMKEQKNCMLVGDYFILNNRIEVTKENCFMEANLQKPINIGSVLYVQMRMIACVAYMNGYELDSNQTQTFVYACLAGVAVNELIKQA